jgi:hypothetical protein
VVVVTGTVVGVVAFVVVVVGFVVVGGGRVVVVEPDVEDVGDVVGVVAFVVVVVGRVVVVEPGVEDVVDVVGVVVETSAFAVPPRYATRRPELTAEPAKTICVRRRTRANRRSRCWGVRVSGVKGVLRLQSRRPR